MSEANSKRSACDTPAQPSDQRIALPEVEDIVDWLLERCDFGEGPSVRSMRGAIIAAYERGRALQSETALTDEKGRPMTYWGGAASPDKKDCGYFDVLFDGPPSHESGRFVEVESPAGTGVKYGEWIDRGDGYWALRFPKGTSPAVVGEAVRAESVRKSAQSAVAARSDSEWESLHADYLSVCNKLNWEREQRMSYAREVDSLRAQLQSTLSATAPNLSELSMREAPTIYDSIMRAMRDHYWDSLEPQKALVLKHIEGALRWFKSGATDSRSAK